MKRIINFYSHLLEQQKELENEKMVLNDKWLSVIYKNNKWGDDDQLKDKIKKDKKNISCELELLKKIIVKYEFTYASEISVINNYCQEFKVK